MSTNYYNEYIPDTREVVVGGVLLDENRSGIAVINAMLTSNEIGEILSLRYDNIQFTIPFEQIAKLVEQTRNNQKEGN